MRQHRFCWSEDSGGNIDGMIVQLMNPSEGKAVLPILDNENNPVHGELLVVTVRVSLPEDAAASNIFMLIWRSQFAGQTVTYKQVAFEQAKKGNETNISGTIPATLSDFKIDPPTLLTIAVKNEIPVRVEMTWRKEK